MTSDDDRDRAVERLLRRSSAGATGSPRPGHCLDPEIAAAWVDGGLLPHERAAVESHVSECTRCQAIVATLTRTTLAGPMAAPWWQRSWRWGWLVPLTAGAAAVVLWIVTPNEPMRPPNEPRDLGAQATTQALKEEPATLADRADRLEKEAPSQEARSNEERPAAPPPSPAGGRTGSDTGQADEADAAGRRRSTTDGTLEANQTAGAAVGESGTISAQAPIPSAAKANAELLAVAPSTTEVLSPDPAVRWRIGAPGVLDQSRDGGATWDRQTIGTDIALAAGTSPSPSVCWLVGRAGTILLTTDGRRWQRVPLSEPVDLVAVQAADARTATVSAGDGRRFRTTDGGTTWVQLPLQEF